MSGHDGTMYFELVAVQRWCVKEIEKAQATKPPKTCDW